MRNIKLDEAEYENIILPCAVNFELKAL